MEPARIRVLLVDDHPIVREGLRALITVRGDIEVVGEASSGEAAVAQFASLRPDVTIMDLRLPGVTGVQAIARIRLLAPSARVVAFTSYGGEAEVQAAMRAGAIACLLKGAPGVEVIEAIRAAASGRRYLSAEAATRLQAAADDQALTPREIDVLALMATGMRNHEIAARLGLALSTVKVHVNRILEKLNVRDRTEAVVVAAQRGIIQLP